MGTKNAPSGRADGAWEEAVRDGGPDRIRTGDLQRDRLACWAATPRVLGRWRMIAGDLRSRQRRRGARLVWMMRATPAVPILRRPRAAARGRRPARRRRVTTTPVTG